MRISNDPDLLLEQITQLSLERSDLWGLPIRTEQDMERIRWIGAMLDVLFAARRRVQAEAANAREQATEAQARARSEEQARQRAARALVALRSA